MESISQLLQTYLKAFTRPFKTQKAIREQRFRERWYQDHNGEDLIPIRRSHEPRLILGIEETIAVSWLMAAIYAFYEIFWLYLGLAFLEHHAQLEVQNFFEGVFQTNIQVISKGFALFWIFLRLTFFPVATWFYAKFWMVIIRFFANLFDYNETPERNNKQEEIERIANQVVCQSLTSYTLLLVPIIGKVLGHFLSVFYIFVGVKKNMGFSNMQSLVVIISPIIFLATIILVWLFSLIVAIGVI